ncbi:hypothetical protein UFOVP1309_67 [uncultured Caudovirales phage]|uniref:Uncharacterized protein n=1 Tax=uncultured Caudovirales phage TaxID=2100421 RepID=A0A6J5RVF7_9CAUD|nr:hypothetical protein UFOVP1309_67 [uncultured Caudovirales phage]
MIYTYKFIGGEMECELGYYPAENAKIDAFGLGLNPYFPSDVVLLTAKLNGIDISELLKDEVVKLIEEKALAEMESKK